MSLPADSRSSSHSLPPYSYVPGHEHPHPVNDPRGHLYGQTHAAPIPPETLLRLPSEPAPRRHALAVLLAKNTEWLYAVELFNEGYYWEAHEAWEQFWHALGRTTPEARLVQGLIHLAAACVKIREGKPQGVTRHSKRARELLGEVGAARVGDVGGQLPGALGLDSESLLGVLQELEQYRPECWHTSRTPVVRVLASAVVVAGPDVSVG